MTEGGKPIAPPRRVPATLRPGTPLPPAKGKGTLLGGPPLQFPSVPPNPIPFDERATSIHEAVVPAERPVPALAPAPAPTPAAEPPAPAAEPAPVAEPVAAVEAASVPAPRTATPPPPPPPLPEPIQVQVPTIDAATKKAVDNFLSAKWLKGKKKVLALPVESLAAYLATLPHVRAQKVVELFAGEAKIALEIIIGAYILVHSYQNPGFKSEELQGTIDHPALEGTKVKGLLQQILANFQPAAEPGEAPAEPPAPPAEEGTEVIETDDVVVLDPAEMSREQAGEYLTDIFNGKIPVEKRKMIANVNTLAEKYPDLSSQADDVLSFLAGYGE